MNKVKPTQTIRCAIYTRKSTEEGLEKEFNLLDAQRESGENYIKAQIEEGWVCLPDRYDDGGFSGGNMERPALKRLLADIEAGKSTASSSTRSTVLVAACSISPRWSRRSISTKFRLSA